MTKYSYELGRLDQKMEDEKAVISRLDRAFNIGFVCGMVFVTALIIIFWRWL